MHSPRKSRRRIQRPTATVAAIFGLGLSSMVGCDAAPAQRDARRTAPAKSGAATDPPPAGLDGAAATPEVHTVTFETVPPEAAVFVDGNQLTGDVRKIEGTDPTRVYKVTGSALGYRSQSMDLTLAGHETVRIELQAETIESPGRAEVAAKRSTKARRRRRRVASRSQPTSEPTPTPPEPTPDRPDAQSAAAPPAAPKPGDDLTVSPKEKPSGSDIDVDVQWAP